MSDLNYVIDELARKIAHEHSPACRNRTDQQTVWLKHSASCERLYAAIKAEMYVVRYAAEREVLQW